MHYVLIKDFNAFMYDHTLHRGRQHCHYCIRDFSTAEIPRSHVKGLRCLKKVNMLDSKIMRGKYDLCRSWKCFSVRR